MKVVYVNLNRLFPCVCRLWFCISYYQVPLFVQTITTKFVVTLIARIVCEDCCFFQVWFIIWLTDGVLYSPWRPLSHHFVFKLHEYVKTNTGNAKVNRWSLSWDWNDPRNCTQVISKFASHRGELWAHYQFRVANHYQFSL